jgi:hypothetical protein
MPRIHRVSVKLLPASVNLTTQTQLFGLGYILGDIHRPKLMDAGKNEIVRLSWRKTWPLATK